GVGEGGVGGGAGGVGVGGGGCAQVEADAAQVQGRGRRDGRFPALLGRRLGSEIEIDRSQLGRRDGDRGGCGCGRGRIGRGQVEVDAQGGLGRARGRRGCSGRYGGLVSAESEVEIQARGRGRGRRGSAQIEVGQRCRTGLSRRADVEINIEGRLVSDRRPRGRR